MSYYTVIDRTCQISRLREFVRSESEKIKSTSILETLPPICYYIN